MPSAEIAYIDESYDRTAFAMSALIVPVHTWRESFLRLQSYRKHLKDRYGIFTSVELHATDFVSGHGRIAPKVVPKALRTLIFRQYIKVLAATPALSVISGCWLRGGMSQNDLHAKAFARIQERLQRRCAHLDSQMILIVDEGKEVELQKLARRTKLWNPVGSQFGAWPDGSPYKNIPNERLIEDPIFKSSGQSYFLQSADFIAFALLKSEVPHTPLVATYKLHTVYDELEPICVKAASRFDNRQMGIVRS